MRRWVMHVDMDAFYASVEQRDNPEYQGRPVIVGGLSSRGVVATASYEARALGVHSAMSMAKAHELCPDGIYLKPRFDVYHAISEQVHEIMHRYTPYIEPLSLDEAFLEMTGFTEGFKSPYEMAAKIKADILEATHLVASVGMAPNKFLAKLASDLRKPNGLMVIAYGTEAEVLAPLPITRLWGVGRQTAKRLRDAGFHKIGDIAALGDSKPLKPILGNQAERVYEMAHGHDDRPVEYERIIQSIGNEETYETDVTDPDFINREWHFFAHKVAKRLRSHGMQGHTVSIKVRYDDFTTVNRQMRLSEPTDSEWTLYRVGRILYNKLTVQKPIRLLGLTVSGLMPSAEHDSLFETDKQERDLTRTLDLLETKFGEGIIMTGSVWERESLRRKEEE